MINYWEPHYMHYAGDNTLNRDPEFRLAFFKSDIVLTLESDGDTREFFLSEIEQQNWLVRLNG